MGILSVVHHVCACCERRSISLDLFQHMLELELNWHLHRKTGEVLRVLDRGTSAIQNILSTVLFSIGPQVGPFAVTVFKGLQCCALRP